jgi:hypothetical protein
VAAPSKAIWKARVEGSPGARISKQTTWNEAALLAVGTCHRNVDADDVLIACDAHNRRGNSHKQDNKEEPSTNGQVDFQEEHNDHHLKEGGAKYVSPGSWTDEDCRQNDQDKWNDDCGADNEQIPG